MNFSCTAIISRMRFGTFSIAALLSMWMTTGLWAGAQQPEQTPAPRPRVALVFEGGGALGFAHIGVLEWMEAHHIPIEIGRAHV